MSDFDEIDITDEDAHLDICELFSAGCCGDELCAHLQPKVEEYDSDEMWLVISENDGN